MTANQIEMLSKIAHSDYTHVNGSEPETLKDVGEVWASDIIESAKDKGTFTSLENVGMVEHIPSVDPRDRCVCLTEAGFAAYKASKE